jgi:hypothetical protein
VGTVHYECKTGEHRALTYVYYIPQLTTSIISVGQLDKSGHEVLIKDGVMAIRDEEKMLLARVHHSVGRLYKQKL